MSNQNEIQSAYVVDGKVFASKKEANDYLRRPQIKEALAGIVNGNEQLSDWLIENQEGVEMAFEVGKIKRVTKTETNQLEKALEAIKAAGDPKFAFVADNADAVLSSFRWPSVKRMTDEEQAVEQTAALTTLAEGNEQVAQFVMKNRDAVLEAYNAGKPKRKISQKALDALAKYREEAKAAKAAESASE